MMNLQNKIVYLTYYAGLKEERGASEETVKTTAATARELYDELQDRYNFCLSRNFLKVSVNDSFSPWQTELKTGDRVVFIPPVCGG